MALFALSDFHLSLATDKPMDVFGDRWKEHHIKIMENWNSQIGNEDTVLVAGDISW
jgi:predicted phosphohydrolase